MNKNGMDITKQDLDRIVAEDNKQRYSYSMLKDGYEFYCSENGVYLTNYVPIKYIINNKF